MPHIGTKVNTVDVEFAIGADGEVKQTLIDLLTGSIKTTIPACSTLAKIYVSATTNGQHQSPRHASGEAIDISRINDKKIAEYYTSDTKIKGFVDAIQDAADKQIGIRENFGPHFRHKHQLNWTVSGHNDHIHLSVD